MAEITKLTADGRLAEDWQTINNNFENLNTGKAEASATYTKTEVDNAVSGKVSKSGDVMSGTLTIGTTVADSALSLRNDNYDGTTTPSTTQMRSFRVHDKNGKILGDVRIQSKENGITEAQLLARKNKADGSNVSAYISAGIDANGGVFTFAPTPATNDNSNKIATTSFVKAQGYTTASGHTHSYLPLSGGTLTGTIQTKATSNAWIAGLKSPAIWCPTGTSANCALAGKTKDGRIGLSWYPSTDNKLYFIYGTETNVTNGTNTVNQMIWDGSTNALTATTFVGALTGHASSDLALSGGTLTGSVTLFNNSSNLTYVTRAGNFSRNTAPSSNIGWWQLICNDKNNQAVGGIYYTYNTDKSTMTRLMCYKGTSTDGTWNSIGIGYDANGNAYTYAPTPATANNSTQIATTAFVKAQGYTTATGHTHSYAGSSANDDYVTSSGKSTDGTAWYRKWKSGWLEQGGMFTGTWSSAGWRTVTLPQNFKDTTYNVVVSYADNTASDNASTRALSANSRAVNSFTLYTSNGKKSWYAFGQGA